MILSCKNIKKSFGVEDILKDVSFFVEDGEKVAVVGVNGAGKTTLFKIITGELAADGGEIVLKKGAKVGYLSQMTELNSDFTVYDEFISVFADLIALEKQLREIEKNMADVDGKQLTDAMSQYARLSHEFEENKGYEYKSRVRGVMKGLGFTEAEFELPIKNLSGGQKTRVSLGKLLLTAPELLLLDEPTNHLDIESVVWLEDYFLRNYSGSVIIISHDRYFLDKTAAKIIEIEHGVSSVYNGNYTYFAYKKEIDREIRLKQYMDQQKMIKKQEQTIRLLKSFNREKSIKRAESREKLLAKIDRIEKPENAPERMRIILEPKITSGNDVLSVVDAEKSFDGEALFKNVSFEIKRGEIVALIGPNGIGKTTLFKMIMNQTDGQGKIKTGANVKIGYYDQEHATLDDEKTIFREISDAEPKLKNLEIRNALAAFVFTGDDVLKTISTLSGGEKGRVALAKMMLGNVNFLMLDEPTNHLDMFSKEILEEALRNYTGTVLYISHDRYFINNTAERIIELTDNGVNSYLGNYDYYIERKTALEAANDAAADSTAEPAAKDEWKRKKEMEAAQRKRLSDLAKTEREIADVEEQIRQADYQLSLEEVYSNYERAQAEHENKVALEQKLDELYQKWDGLSES